MSDELNPYPGNLKHHKVDAPKREPLLSDDAIMDMWYFGDPNDTKNLDVPIDDAVPDDYYEWGGKDARDFYEAARAKDAELIQRLVDALEGLVYLEFCNDEGLSSGAPTSKDWKNAFDKAQQQIDAAAAAGYKPTQAE